MGYPCPQCKYKFAHRKKYNEHMKKCHSVSSDTKEDDDRDESSSKTKQIKIPKQSKPFNKKIKRHGIDVEMKTDSNMSQIDKKRKYSHYQSEQQPRKRRKLNH